MLTDEEKQEIEAEAAHYEQKQAACIEALKVVQRRRGWVSDEAVRAVGDLLGMSFADLDGVATFYNLIYRQPVGRHAVMLCNSVSCWVMGYERIRERLVERLGIQFGQTTADGRFTLLPIVCLGACDRGPTLMVDGDLHGSVDPDALEEILERYR